MNPRKKYLTRNVLRCIMVMSQTKSRTMSASTAGNVLPYLIISHGHVIVKLNLRRVKLIHPVNKNRGVVEPMQNIYPEGCDEPMKNRVVALRPSKVLGFLHKTWVGCVEWIKPGGVDAHALIAWLSIPANRAPGSVGRLSRFPGITAPSQPSPLADYRRGTPAW